MIKAEVNVSGNRLELSSQWLTGHPGAGQPASQSASQSVSQPASQSASQLASQPVSQSVSQSASQPAGRRRVGRSVGRSVSQSCSNNSYPWRVQAQQPAAECGADSQINVRMGQGWRFVSAEVWPRHRGFFSCLYSYRLCSYGLYSHGLYSCACIVMAYMFTIYISWPV